MDDKWLDVFVHLHTHTKYSLNDGMIDAKKLAKKLKAQGVKKYAVTEHGVLMNMPEAYKELKAEGIELIVGMEAYVAPRSRTQKEGKLDSANYHLVLLCKNNEGYDNLKKIASDAALNGFYYKPRTDKQFLREHHEGLIGMSACLGGSINRLLMDDKYDEAKREALEYLDIFGEGNFFLEIQRHGLEEQEKINPLIIKLSRETGIPLVATNDNHYLDQEDWQAHDIQMAIQAGTTVKDTKRKVYTSHEFYVKSPQEMARLFKDIPEAIENTAKIAERCHVELEFGVNKIPPFHVPEEVFKGTNREFLKAIVYKGAESRYPTPLSDEIVDRIEYELEVIDNMGYTNYFLINWDFFRFCKEGTYELTDTPDPNWVPILTGPGRGSGAGSIVLYCTDCTKIDPIKYNLLFERFLDPSRISMPDVDSDFESTRRQEVIDYVVYKYGRNSIAQIITFGTLAARAVIRKVGKALDLPYAIYDKTAKMIPTELGITIGKALEINKDLNNLYNTNSDIRTLLDFSMKLEGLPTNTSTHAAGVLITDSKGVTAHVPMWKNDSGIVAQYDKDILESLGLLKMDFLGLKTLGVCGQARDFVKKNHGVDIDFDEIYKIPTLEPLKLIREGKTTGIFQLEGAGMTNFMKELKPESIEDIIAGISLYRPGPMGEIPKFIYNKRNPDKVQYPFPEVEEILKETYGILTYQEQCMRAVIAIAGYDKSDSDGFRRTIAKKKLKEIPYHRKWFIEGRKIKDENTYGRIEEFSHEIPGGLAKGHDRKELSNFFDKMEHFGSYAFNKSHAAAYAYVGYLTAWEAFHYPAEFMAALLNSVQGNRPRVARYIDYCRRVLNIDIVEPDINSSTHEFNPLPDGSIVYSLSIKGASTDCLKKIVEEREANGDYESLMDFIVRTRDFLDKGTYEGLIGAGAFKRFGIVKSQHLAALDEFWDGCLKKSKEGNKKYLEAKAAVDSGAIETFSTIKKRNTLKALEFDFEEDLLQRIDGVIPEIREFPKEIELRLEKELLGLYLTDNPLYKYAYTIQTKSNFCISDIEYDIDEETGAVMISNENIRDRQSVRFVAILNDVFEITTKKKTLMCRMELEDLTGVASALVWPSTYDVLKKKMKPGDIYMCYGSLKISSDEAPTIVIDDLEVMEDIVTERIILTVDDAYEAKEVVENIRKEKVSQGMTPIYLVHGQKRILLRREYWVNLNYIMNKYGNKAKIEMW